MKGSHLRRAAIAVYVLSFPAALLIGERFGQADRFGSKAQTVMPMLIGLFCLAPFVMLASWMVRVAPSASRVLFAILAAVLLLLLNPGTVRYALFLPFPLFFVALYIVQREARLGYEAWLRANNFVPVDPTAIVLEKLNQQNQWRCYAGSLSSPDGKALPVILWEGIGTTTAMRRSGGPLRTKFGLIAVSLTGLDSQNLTGREFENQRRRERPYLAERLPDGTFLVAWIAPHARAVLEEKLQALRAVLQKSAGPSP